MLDTVCAVVSQWDVLQVVQGGSVKPDRFYKFTTSVYADIEIEQHSVYQTLKLFIRSKTGVL